MSSTQRDDRGGSDGDPLGFLSRWLRSEWDGAEQPGVRGVTIEAVDGPGWWLTIDLRQTHLEGRTVDPGVLELGSARWCQYWSDGHTFTAATSVFDLALAIDVFRGLAGTEGNTHPA